MDLARTMVPAPDEPDGDLPPFLIPAAEVARLLNVSKRTLWRLLSAGRLPTPVRLGNSVRWRRDQLQQWISEGCPPCRTNFSAR